MAKQQDSVDLDALQTVASVCGTTIFPAPREHVGAVRPHRVHLDDDEASDCRVGGNGPARWHGVVGGAAESTLPVERQERVFEDDEGSATGAAPATSVKLVLKDASWSPPLEERR
jgi:hypothetical protein